MYFLELWNPSSINIWTKTAGRFFFRVLQQTERHIGSEQYEGEQTMSEFRIFGLTKPSQDASMQSTTFNGLFSRSNKCHDVQ